LTEYSKTVRVRIGKWYAKNLLTIDPGFNVHLEKWNKEQNECTLTMTCFDDYPFPKYRKNKDDLELYLVKKFGSMIVEDKRKPVQLDLSAASKGIPLKHPLVLVDKKDYPSLQDNFSEEYFLPLTKKQLREANGTLPRSMRIKPDNVKKTSGYESDVYNVRIGTWRS
jgi:hypothetical protein